MNILIINGPNLNLLGKRDPKIYGTKSMETILIELQRLWHDVCFTYKQSNHEGDIIDWINEGLINDELKYDGIVLNAGGYTHTSVSIRDAVELCTVPVVEVHISDILNREPFRRTSLLTDVCQHSIIGHGTDGYNQAVQWLNEYYSH